MTRADIIRMAMDVDGHMNDRRDGIDLSWDSLVQIVQKAIDSEREACAKVAETYEAASSMKDAHHIAMIFKDCAAAIRARGQEAPSSAP